LQMNARNQRRGLIVPLRNTAHDSLPLKCPPAQTSHLGIGSTLIHKHQPGGRLLSYLLMPGGSFFHHVGAILFGGEQSFFYTSNPIGQAIDPPWKF